ncbi:hypothetical protein NM688_g6542 [Phlebia brevispora]|uniref:Uncharacterized protein n=1 Tax=Phlebia brevispora TaxID=194682 RepID=A0ACC1SEX2_9APHY|nr:hypothetical protein NM688_g6542 [Phlebia brevispora]
MAANRSFQRFWDTPELKLHLGKTFDTKKDLLHLALTDKATCTLLLPLLYEKIRIALVNISAIVNAFNNYPEYAAQCTSLIVESPDEVELAYERQFSHGLQNEVPVERLEQEDVGWIWGDNDDHSVAESEVSDPADWIMADDDDEDLPGHGNGEDDLDGEEGEGDEHDHDDDDEDDDGSDDEDALHDEDDDNDGPDEHVIEIELPGEDLVDYKCTELMQFVAGAREYNEQEDKARVEASTARHNAACAALTVVLNKLSECGRLKDFEWLWDSLSRSYPVNGAEDDLWEAVEQNSSSVEKLVIKFFRGDKWTWCPFASPDYSALRVLCLDMSNSHHWSAQPLHTMLKNLPELEALDLKLTWCCAVVDMTLAGTCPKLRYFAYSSGALQGEQDPDDAPPSEFLQRHPLLDTLHLDIDRHITFNYKPEDLPHLRAISYGRHKVLSDTELGNIVSHRPVVAVRCHLKAGLLNFVGLPTSAALTVKWLDLKYRTNFRLDLPDYAAALRAVPGLVELTIRTRSRYTARRLTASDLVDTLNALPHDHKSLTALTLFDPDGDALTQQDLENLPPVPPTLKYLSWEVASGRTLYRLEKQGEKTIAVEIPYPRKRSWVWTQTSILDHFEGEPVWTDPFDGDEFPCGDNGRPIFFTALGPRLDWTTAKVHIRVRRNKCRGLASLGPKVFFSGPRPIDMSHDASDIPMDDESLPDESLPRVLNRAGCEIPLSLESADDALRTALTWDSIDLELASDTKLARRCLEILDRSDALTAKIRSLTIGMIDDDALAEAVRQLLVNLIPKMKNLEYLHLEDRCYHYPEILAALCTPQESRLKSLNFDVQSYTDKDASFFREKDLRLTRGRLEELEIECSEDTVPRSPAWPQAITNAVSQLIRTSALTIEELCLQGVPNAVIKQLAINMPHFPALRRVDVATDFIEGPGFVSVHPTVTYMRLYCYEDTLSFVTNPNRLRSTAQRFPSLKGLGIKLEVEDRDVSRLPSSLAMIDVLKKNLLSLLPQLERFSLEISLEESDSSSESDGSMELDSPIGTDSPVEMSNSSQVPIDANTIRAVWEQSPHLMKVEFAYRYETLYVDIPRAGNA